MPQQEGESVRDKARVLAAKLTERIAKNVINPPKKPLSEHMLVLVSVWKAKDESVVQAAVDKGKRRAEGKEQTGMMGKMFFGLLRFMGFGHIESTGEGGVEVVKNEDAEDLYTITTTIGVKVDNSEALAATLLTMHDRAKKVPQGIISALVGVKPGHAQLVELQADLA